MPRRNPLRVRRGAGSHVRDHGVHTAPTDRETTRRDAGIPHLYYALLARLSEAPGGRMRMTGLAVHADITRSRLSHAVTRMEKSGWIRRDTCPSDRRGHFAVLTDEGALLVRRAAPGHVDAVRRGIFDRLTPEQAARFGELCGLIAGGFRDEDGDLPWRR
ncbi:MarR family winged helix-turn-helix transcriptional regulator [Streptomyces sp. NPDC058671]|uniref:MarR family winged helix-turn-helix transcriptional regulator n=1 Tax=Streptomyces sp. NPDC058671 TaxID=3346590 RepID=UPI00364C6951